MESFPVSQSGPAWVAIDIAKNRHEALIETWDGRRRRTTVANTLADFNRFADELKLHHRCEVALEPTGDYHRPIANFLTRRGHRVHFVSSITTNRTREALFNSWDKNDPKDAQVILHLLKSGTTQVFSDPLECGNHDLQELLGTYRQLVDRKTRLYHSLQTHYFPLYFPEAERFLGTPRTEWFLKVLQAAPCPAVILRYSKKSFVRKFTAKGGKITMRQRLVSEYYEAAKESVGIPVAAGSWAIKMFQFAIEQYAMLTKQRRLLEETIHQQLERNKDYQVLRSIPGIGPIIALTVLARPATCDASVTIENFWTTAAFRFRRRNQATAGERLKFPNAGTRAFAVLFGWQQKLRSNSGATVSDASSMIMCESTRSTPTSNAKRTPLWPPRWRESPMGSLNPEKSTATSSKRRCPMGESFRLGRRGACDPVDNARISRSAANSV